MADGHRGLTRRSFLAMAGLALAPLACVPKREATRVLVVGAGISGLAAASQLRKQGHEVVVVEARDRIGGRIWTDRTLGVPVDLGASWIHGPQGNPLTGLARQAGVATAVTPDDEVTVWGPGGPVAARDLVDAESSYWDLLEAAQELAWELDSDINLSQAVRRAQPGAWDDPLHRYFLKAYTEFEVGASADRISARSWDDDEAFEGADVVLPGGYDALIRLLAEGLDIRLNEPVLTIRHGARGAAVETEKGSREADHVVVTLPLGVLQSSSIRFVPTLTNLALNLVSMGVVNKVALLWDEPFWSGEQYFGFTQGEFPYYLNASRFAGAPMLMTFALGAVAEPCEAWSESELRERALAPLRSVWPQAPYPKAVLRTRWRDDPFARGAYSYAGIGVTAEDFAALGRPVGDSLLFAGEHTHPQYRASVHGAYLSGLREAERIARM